MYTLAQSQGYQDSQADFEQLLATDAKALGTMYGLAQDNGYAEDLESFEILMGLKKRGARRYGVCIGRWFFGATDCS